MKYAVRLDSRTWKDIQRLSEDLRGRILGKLRTLENDPRPQGVEKLAGPGNLYRARVGDWRIVYAIRDRELVVIVIRVGHRRDVYR